MEESSFLLKLRDAFVLVLSKIFSIDSVLVLISNITWTAMALYSLKSYNVRHRDDLMRFAYVTFLINALNSSMGLTEFFYENVMSSMRTLLEVLQATLALPCLTTEVWLKHGVAQNEAAWLHTVVGLIPTYVFLFQHYTRQDLIDFVVVMNAVSLMGVGFAYRDLYAMCSSATMFLSYCVFFFRSELAYESASRQMSNYCMALFTFCGYKSVMGVERLRSRTPLTVP